MAQISGAGTPVDIKLGQVPQTTNPALRNEFQQIYNALHILSQYLEVLRAGLEGDDSQTPAENIRFLKFITAPAKQKIVAGNIVSPDFTDGQIVKGTSYGDLKFVTYNDNIGRTNFTVSGMVQTFFGIAQNDAEIGELVTMGVGPAILKVTGAISGQQVWAYTARGVVYTYANTVYRPPDILGYEYSEAGDIYLGYPYMLTIPGYPKPVTEFRSATGKAQASPIGIAVANDYVLFSDFQYWTGRQPTSIFEDH